MKSSRTLLAAFCAALSFVSISRAQTPAPSTTSSLEAAAAPTPAISDSVWLRTKVRGKSVEAGGTAEYEVTVGNATGQPQKVALSFEPNEWAAMTASVEPAAVDLAPKEEKTVMVKIKVPARVPPGGHETQTLRATGSAGSPAAALIFVTASKMGFPYILHTADGWAEVREKVKKYDWAKEQQQDYVSRAEKWVVPNVRNPKDPKRGDWLFPTQVENDLMAAGTAYQLTLDKKYADKVRTFLLRLSDPTNGYPVTRRGCNQDSVQEGHFFQHIAMAYDMAIPSGLFADAERAQIDQTLRLFVGEEEASFGSNISNWTVSYECGQLYCALVLQDLAAASRILYCHGALIDQFTQGMLDDGWWFEVSISYNTWVATEYSQVAIALRPWGLNLADAWFPASFRPENVKPPHEEEFGMSRARWGPIYHNYVNIKRMWDVLPRMVDWRGVLFGLNDSAEKPIVGTQMDIAYYLYRDPGYATMIKRGGDKRDLLYGVPELPENTPDRSLESTFADNAGVAVLRSQSPERPPRERIQAVLHYGDHGWYHGHFDQTNLVHLSRYGRSFYNPEMIWYGYPSYLYKFYVQTSVSKNMVVVDQKQQEPTESQRLLFHSGPMMQAAAVETNARWSNPPYGGMVYENQTKSFPEKSFKESRSIPIPKDAPPYAKFGSVTGYTEPVLQRRLMVVTDDYVLLADYLKGEREHTFDSLFQMKGFQGLEAPGKKLVRHTGQWNPDPLSAAQFVTDCDWYEVQAPARGSYQFRYGPGADNAGNNTHENTDGVLNMDLHTLWPPKQEIILGMPPEVHPVERQVSYAVRGDGKPLAEGKSGIWILGQVEIDLSVENVKSLELETQTGVTRLGTLFWAGARIVTADGKETPLAQLPVTSENAMQPKEPGKDFAGGPIKIAGLPYTNAVSAQPQDGKKPSLVRVDLSNVKAVRFKAVLGGDFPLGDEAQRRKTVAIRAKGQEARFLTVIEPFEDKRMIKSASATGPDTLRVELTDGRVQEIKITGLETSGKEPTVQMTETKDGKATRTETTSPAQPSTAP